MARVDLGQLHEKLQGEEQVSEARFAEVITSLLPGADAPPANVISALFRAFDTDASGAVELVMTSCEHPKAPPTVGVRADLMRSAYRLEPLGAGKTRFSVEIHTDPKGSIPTWLVNMLQKSWPLETLSAVRRVA